MFGLIVTLLLLPTVLNAVCKILLNEDNPIYVFIDRWYYNNLYWLGVIFSACIKAIVPPKKEDDAPEDSKDSNENFKKGIDDTWK